MNWFINAIRQTAFVPKESDLEKQLKEANLRIKNLEMVCKQFYAAIEHIEGKLFQISGEQNIAKKREHFILNHVSGKNIELPEYVRSKTKHRESPAYSHIKYLPAFRLATELSDKRWLQEDIATALSARGYKTAKGKPYTQAIVSILLSNKFLQTIHKKEQEAAKQNAS
jgi:hypothetical protein